MTSLRVLTAALLTAGCLASVHAQSVRADVGKPLQQASELLRAGRAKEALVKIRDADAVAGKTAQEQLMIDRMRGAAAQRAGDTALAVHSFESAFNSGHLPAGEQAQVAESIAYGYSQLRDNARATQWVQKAESLGDNSAQLKQLQSYLQGQSGDYSAIARDAAAAVSNAEKAGRRPDEGDLLRLADAQQRMHNLAGQGVTLEKLVANYGKKEYWAAALDRLPRKPGFSDRFALDVMRLKLATGNLNTTQDYMEMAQLALQAGYAAEGKRVVDKGFAAGVLGTGPEAARHKRLQALAERQEAQTAASMAKDIAAATAAPDGNDLVQLGSELASMGQADKGVALIEQGLAKGQLKHPEDARLMLGRALLQTGKNKAKAQQVLRSVQGSDGAADVARLWAIQANQQ